MEEHAGPGGRPRPLKPFEDIDHPRVSILPRPAVAEALQAPVTRRLLVTDVGWFEHAEHHVLQRPHGATESIVILCVDGSGWVEVDGTRHGVGAGTVALIPSPRPHGYGSSSRAPWTIWWCHLRGSDAQELFAATGATPDKPVVDLWSPERCAALIDEILTGMTRGQSPVRLVAATGAAFKLLTQIASDRLSPARDDPVQRALAYLADRTDGGIRVADLARLVGLSESRFATLFREATGGGVLAHHSSLRMARARQLLDSGPMPVAEVARRLGYEDPLYFSRVFRRTHGMSPTEYRAQRKG